MLWGLNPKLFNSEQLIVPAICIITILQTSDGVAITCKGCRSDRQSGFNGEIAIHFRADSKALNKLPSMLGRNTVELR
jgi:hypothetical protein